MQQVQPVDESADCLLSEALQHFAACTPERIAVRTASGTDLTYSYLNNQVTQWASAITQLRKDAPVVIGVLCADVLSFAQLLLAATRVDVTVTPFERNLPLSMLIRQINDAGCTHLLVDADWPHEEICARALKTRMPTLLQASDLTNHKPANTFAQDSIRQSRLLLRTSGTTGRPKQVELSLYRLGEGAKRVADSIQLTPADAGLCVMPLTHVHGLVAGLLAPLVSGGTVVLGQSHDTSQLLKALTQHDITWFSAVPSIHLGLIDTPGFETVLNACTLLRVVRSASSALPERVREFYGKRHGPKLIEAYGMTEAAHQISSQHADDPSIDGSVGKVSGESVRIRTEASTNAATDATSGRGEIVLNRMLCAEETGEEQSTSSEVSDWFRTGDIGRIDDNGNLFLTGRIKEMINRGGESIAPVAIDDVLSRVDGISQAASFGAPHPTLGEVVAVAIVLDSQSSATHKQLRLEVSKRLPMSHVPVHYLTLDVLPTTSSGKLNRAALPALLKADSAHV